MKQENVNYLAVGTFVLLAGVALVLVLLRLTGHGLHEDSYYTVFDRITGIEEGSPVTYGGYRIGQVAQIAPLRSAGATRYRLLLRLESGWTIPKDSVARIVTPGMLSDNVIDIAEGQSSAMLAPGATIASGTGANVMAMLEGAVGEFGDLSDNHIKPLIKHIDERFGRIGDHIESQIPEITANINRVLTHVNQNADQLAVLLGDANQQHIASLLENADQISTRLNHLAATVDGAGDNVEQLMQRLDSVVSDNNQDLRQAIVDLRKTLDSVAGNIDTLLYHWQSTSRNMDEFSRQLRDNPAVLLRSKAPQDEAVPEK